MLWWVCLFCRFSYIGSKSTTKKKTYIWSEKRKRSVKCVLWSLSIKISVRTRRSGPWWKLWWNVRSSTVWKIVVNCLFHAKYSVNFDFFGVLNGQFFSVVSILQYFLSTSFLQELRFPMAINSPCSLIDKKSDDKFDVIEVESRPFSHIFYWYLKGHGYNFSQNLLFSL